MLICKLEQCGFADHSHFESLHLANSWVKVRTSRSAASEKHLMWSESGAQLINQELGLNNVCV